MVARLPFVIFFGMLVYPACAIADAALCAALAAHPFEDDVQGVELSMIQADRAVAACEQAVHVGPHDVASIYRLARAYVAGGDFETARGFALIAAEAGYPYGFQLLGTLKLNGWGQPTDPQAAYNAFSRAYELGLTEAGTNLAYFYRNGVVVTANPRRALEYYRESAEAGLGLAQFALAQMIAQGDGTSADEASAIKWYMMAADGGYVPAKLEMARRYFNGQGVVRNDAEGFRLAQEAAINHDAWGAYLVGFAFEHGRGVVADSRQAARWYLRSSQGGEPRAKYEFGRMLEEGKGVTADAERARGLYAEAAESGIIEAQARLGRMMALGLGGPKDIPAALDLLDAASAHPVATHTFALMAWSGEGVQQDRERALVLIREAADSGLVDAQVDAARFLTSEEIGAGHHDVGAAVAYLEDAALKGHPDALLDYGARLANGDGVEQDRERALEMFERAAELGVRAGTIRAMDLRIKLRVEQELQEARDAVGETEARIEENLAEQDEIRARIEENLARIEGNRAQIERNRARQDELVAEACARNFLDREDLFAIRWNDMLIFNTRDGSAWYDQRGRLLPASEAPNFRCPR